jgi:short-subunit dehydrogenase
MNQKTVLITGCTSGIGLHLAHEFARHGHDLVLVAPVESELKSVASELQRAHAVDCAVIPADLELAESADEIFARMAAAGIEVEVLVNNAGHGFRGKFWQNTIGQDISMVNLNICAPLRLTKLVLPAMLSRGHGRILNTASIAGFEPGPMLGVYHATKAFLLSWSEALSVELADTGITVTALCPGATDTDFFPKANMVDVAAFQKGYLMAPQDVAKAGYAALMEGEMFVVPGVPNKMMVAARRILPQGTQAKINEKLYETVPPEDRSRERGDVEMKAQKDH